MSATSPTKACACPVCNLPGRAVAALPQARLEALVASPYVEHGDVVAPSGGPNFLLMGMGAVAVLASSRMMFTLFGEDPTSGAPFEAPLLAVASMISNLAPWIAMPILILSGVGYMFFASPGSVTNVHSAINTPWEARFKDLRLCKFCHRIFDQNGRSELADSDGFRRMMEQVDYRGESRTWILNGGFSGQRHRSRATSGAGHAATDAASTDAPSRPEDQFGTTADTYPLAALAMATIGLTGAADALAPTDGLLPIDSGAAAAAEPHQGDGRDQDGCAWQDPAPYETGDMAVCEVSPAQFE